MFLIHPSLQNPTHPYLYPSIHPLLPPPSFAPFLYALLITYLFKKT